MNEEKHPTFPDKYHLSRKESVYLLKKTLWNWCTMRGI